MAQQVLNDTIRTLYDHFYDNYEESLTWQRHEAYKAANRQYPGISKALQYARGLARFLSEKPVVCRGRDLLAGHIQYVNTSASIPIRYTNPQEPHEEVEGFDPINPADFAWDVAREAACYRELRGAAYTEEEDEVLRYFLKGFECGLETRWANGHVIAGYEYVLRLGYRALEAGLLKGYEAAEGVRKDYFEAMLTVVQAAAGYIGRYEKAAAEAAETAETAEQRRALERITCACGFIKTEAPVHFFEAVQALMLLHEMILYENHTGSMSLGRVDQILGPYYERDKALGLIDFDEAGELIEALWLKLASVVQGFQNVTLGGCDIQGNSVSNDITLLCLRASRKLRQDQPLLSLRYHKDMPGNCWEETLGLILQGGGFPALFNDDVVIPAREQLGVDKSDAWNYGMVGCVEPSICGKEYSTTEELRMNWAKVLELMLNGGVCTVTGAFMGLAYPKNLEDIGDFETFYAWFKDEFTATIRKCIRACNMLEISYPEFFPSPLLSATIEGCIERGEDASARGPRYCFSTINGCAMANTVDSLLAIKEIVFDRKLVSLRDFAKVLACNYEGYGELLAYARNRCLKYGNDISEADQYMKEIVDLFCITVRGQRNSRGGSYQAGLYTVSAHAAMGRKTGALPDGREKGVSLSNAVSPVQGMDTQGPTASIRSALVFDHRQAANGLVLDLKFNPSFFEKESHRKMLRALVESYFDQGGMEIQFNVVSRETLLEAQQDPQKYKNLIVRVSGFSAYFVSLDKVLQDEIIKRTEHYAI
jgi:formate C-acetyltransferase